MLQKLTILALFACAFCWTTAAQDQVKAPKLLILEREEIKPGKVTAHTQAASRFVQLAEKNQAGVYRVGGMAIAGNTNEIFYFSFADSYADYERNVDFPQPMAAELVNLEAQTGDVHNSQRTVIAEFVPALSYRPEAHTDRKSTRLNSSHLVISYAVFCLKKKKKKLRHHIAADLK